MFRGNKWSYFLYVTVLLLVLTACGNSGVTTVDPADLDAAEASLEELAKKEGKVVFYGTPTINNIESTLRIFENKYGIQVEYVHLRGGEMVERLNTERKAGRNNVDLVVNGPTPMWIFKNEGYLTEYLPSGTGNVLGTDPEGYYAGTYLVVYGMLVNTDLVPEDKIPKTWEDLLDPYWKGKIYADDPRIQGGGNSVFSMFYDDERYGPEFLKKLAEQDLVFTRQKTQYEEAVGRGEVPIYIHASSEAVNRLQGTATKWIAVEEYTPYLYCPTGILNDAPHPNAAKLLAEFLVTEEAQTEFAKHMHPALEGVKLPLEEMDVTGNNMVTQTEHQLANQPEYADILTKIFFE